MLPLLSALGLLGSVKAAENGLARTPQMGWNTWNKFACDISEDLILSAADAVVNTGLKDLGYEYIVVDDCWQAASRESGTNKPVANSERFPNGIKHLSDNVHNLGLKMGIYSSAGTMTCGRKFGSLDHEEIDAQTYAEWEIDYLKYDNCYNQGRAGTPLVSYERYANMSRALNATGRPILYSMCNWGEDGTWNWATEIANSWRMSGDIKDTFPGYDDRCPCTSMLDCKLSGYHCAASRILDFAAPLGQKAGPGRWNDLDMLEVGNGGMTYDEYVTHFSMWAAVKSPLILGNDVTAMTEETLEIITNKAVIAVSQDPLGSPAVRIWKKTAGDGDIQLWVSNLVNSTTAIALVNTASKSQKVDLLFADAFEDSPPAARKASYRLYDLWAQKTTEPPSWSSVSSQFPSFVNSSGSSNSTLQKVLARSTNWGKDIGVHQGSVKGVSVPAHGVKIWRAELATPAAATSVSASSASRTMRATTATSRTSSGVTSSATATSST
ncbi:glycoside hydrolase family 27 protein [Ceratobasidium sp. AG-Ba]|nr:glycoside hydrolase family 27 protein [Ceratobasidium sp. AG-Ba]QRW06803.1 glycoside hydrolase family 27 protein [Ceratobasidium sp. AG-Ba]